MVTLAMAVDRKASLAWFWRNRRRSADLFETVRPEAYYDRPIPLRNPICFYEGHLPAFCVNTLVKRGLGEPGVDPRLEVLFERGIDPEGSSRVPGSTSGGWPERKVIRRYAAEADGAVAGAIESKEIERDDNPVLRRGLALWTILEHEPMHQETLSYMWH
ncbi:MAG: DinB family protein, partial [Thermoanaerobaculia bacterium]